LVENIEAVLSSEIANVAILKSLEEYEKGKAIPAPLSLAELKIMLDA